MSLHITTATITSAGGGAGFNGGRSQMDLAVAEYDGSYPFLNAMKSGQGWSLISPGGMDPSILDANGYPKSIPGGSGGIQQLSYIPKQTERPGNYVLKWTGNGIPQLASGQTATAYVITAASKATDCVLTCAVDTSPRAQIPFNLRVGQPIAISGVTGTGWTALNATWPILAVDTVAKTFTISLDSSGFAGSAGLSGTSKATNVLTTTLSVGLNGSGRYVFATTYGGFTDGGPLIGVVSVQSSSDYPHDMVFCHESDEADLDAGKIFHPKFLAKLREANNGVLRFHNWTNTVGTCNATSWWTRRPESYAFWCNNEPRASLYCGPTSAATDGAYTCSAPAADSVTGGVWAGLKDKTTVITKFSAPSGVVLTSAVNGSTTTQFNYSTSGTPPVFSVGEIVYLYAPTGTGWSAKQGTYTVTAAAAGTATVTLDSSALGTLTGGTLYHKTITLAVGGGPAKNIRNPFSNELWSAISSYPMAAPLAINTLVYDITLDSWIKQDQALNNPMPPEVCMKLCIEVGAHVYYNTPMYTQMPVPTDYMPQLAAYCVANAPAWMIPRFEGTNELWNHAGGFYAAWYAENQRNVINGMSLVNGAFINNSFSMTAFTYGGGFSTITFGSAHPYIAGSAVAVTISGTGLIGLPTLCYVTSKTSNTITINSMPTSGTWASGGSVTSASGDNNNWYGEAISYVGQMIAAAYGGAPGNLGVKYHVLLGVQTANAVNQTGGTDSTTNSNPRAYSYAFIAEGVAAPGYTCSEGYKWASHVVTAQYWKCGAYNRPFETSMITAFNVKKFVASVAAGTMTITSTQIAGSPTLAIGDTVFGQNIAISDNITIAGGSGSVWTLSSPITLTSDTIYAGTDMTAIQKYIDTSVGSRFTGSISGGVLTVITPPTANDMPIVANDMLTYAGSSNTVCVGSFISGSNWNINPVTTPNVGSTAMNSGPITTVPSLGKVFKLWWAWAQSLPVNNNGVHLGLTGYEGSYSPDYLAGAATAQDNFLYATKFVTTTPYRTNGLYDYWTENMNNFVTAGGQFPSVFMFTGRYPSVGVWSLLETIYQTPMPPQWNAMVAFNA